MGLCKCPKRKVTNLFCFEHRVNVCEHCLVANHDKCIVKSYLQWLQDSDYNPICTLCDRPLSDEECGECVRLTCYDVFHWMCLNRYCQQLPPNTAPAGYTCPTCNTCIFPPANLATPVAEALRHLLQQTNWARAGLGLPLIDEPDLPARPPPARQEADVSPLTSTPLKADLPSGFPPTSGNVTRPSAQVPPYTATPTPAPSTQGGPHSVISVDEGTSARQFTMPRCPPTHLPPPPPLPLTPRVGITASSVWTRVPRPGSSPVPPYTPTPTPTPAPSTQGGTHSVVSVDEGTSARQFTNPRKLFDSTKDDGLFNQSHDHDEDKYKRRPAFQWLAHWFKSRDGGKKKDPNAVRKRFFMVLCIGIIAFITLIIVFSQLGRHAADDDPFLDPMNNPNIKVQQEQLADFN